MRHLVTALALVSLGAAFPGRLSLAQLELVRQSEGLRDKAIKAWSAGRRAEAVKLAAMGLEADRKIWGKYGQDLAEGTSNLAGWHERMGNWDKAITLHIETLANLTGLHGPDSWEVTNASWTLADARKAADWSEAKRADLLRGRDDTQKAMAFSRPDKALPIEAARANVERWRRLVGEWHPGYALALHALGVVHHARGELAEAADVMRLAVKPACEALGEGHPETMMLLTNLSATLTYMGDYRDALAAGRKALAARIALHGPEHPAVALILHNLSGLYNEMGDLRSGIALASRALAMRRRLLGEKHPATISTHSQLAHITEVAGDLAEALAMRTRIVRVSREVFGLRHADYAVNLNALAWLHLMRGEPKEALPHFKEALAVTRAALGASHPHYATALNNLASALEAMDDPAALSVALDGLALTGRLHGAGHTEFAVAAHNLAALHQQMGRNDAALLLSERALRSAHGRLALAASAQAERAHREAMVGLMPFLGLRLVLDEPDAGLSHAHVLAWKGAAFAAGQRRRVSARLAKEGDDATRRDAAELERVTAALAVSAMRPGRADVERAERLNLVKAALEEKLALAGPDLRLALRPPTSAALVEALPDGVALVDFLVWRPLARAAGKPAPQRLSAWVARKGRPVARFDLGEAEPLTRHLAAWRKGLESGKPEGEHPAKLREKIWIPLEKHVAGARVVLLAPDGALGKLPFAALPGKGKGKYLIEEVPLAFFPVPRLLAEAARSAASKPSLLVVGAVDFGDGLGVWEGLPATRPEMDAVAAGYKVGPVTRLSEKGATKAAVRAALVKVRHAHLATHGYFSPVSMRGVPGFSRRLSKEGVAGWHPELLSGLVLAGANRPVLADDGILTALEVASLDLSGMDLAVLSACKTGLGEEAAGEGMLGLQRAFGSAGCRSVVSSLWSVHDAATSVLMNRFYHYLWEKKHSKIEALRQAQLEVMRNPEWVERRIKDLNTIRGLRGVGEVEEIIVAGKKARRSPVAWWAAWQLSGDWR